MWVEGDMNKYTSTSWHTVLMEYTRKRVVFSFIIYRRDYVWTVKVMGYLDPVAS